VIYLRSIANQRVNRERIGVSCGALRADRFYLELKIAPRSASAAVDQPGIAIALTYSSNHSRGWRCAIAVESTNSPPREMRFHSIAARRSSTGNFTRYTSRGSKNEQVYASL
jgi:hypothetical protein